MKLFSYIRVSGRGQLSGEGPDRQRESIRTWAVNHKIIGEFFEAGVSGTIEGIDRPEFANMVEAIINRRLNGEEIDGIVVERLDRLARDLMVQEMLLKLCRENNIKVFAADQSDGIDIASDGGDPTRKLIRQVIGALAEWEKSQLVLKLKKARDAIKARTGYCGGSKPYGNTPEEVVILRLLKTVVSPDSTCAEVAEQLNLHGLTTRFGTKFSPRAAWRMMKVAGVWTAKDPVGYRLKNLGDKRKVGETTIGQLKGQ